MGIESIELKGDKELFKLLNELKATSARKIMRPAVNAGLTPISRRAKALARSNFASDTIAKMIGKAVSKAKRGSHVIGRVFIKPDSNRTITVEGKEKPFEVAANILEFGRLDGSLPARSFMRRAREEMSSQALNIVKKKADEVLKKEWKKGSLKFK